MMPDETTRTGDQDTRHVEKTPYPVSQTLPKGDAVEIGVVAQSTLSPEELDMPARLNRLAEKRRRNCDWDD